MLKEHENLSMYQAWGKKHLKDFLEQGQEDLVALGTKVKENESKLISHIMKRCEAQMTNGEEIKKLDLSIADESSQLLSCEKWLESIPRKEIISVQDIEEMEKSILALNALNDNERAEELGEHKRSLRRLIFEKIDEIESQIALCSFEKVKTPKERSDEIERLNMLLQGYTSQLLDLEKKLEPFGGRKFLQQNLAKTVSGEIVDTKAQEIVHKIAGHLLQRLKKIREIESLNALIEQHEKELLEDKKNLEQLGGSVFPATGLSRCVKDEKEDRIAEKLYSSENERPVWSTLFRALEELCVLHS